MEKLNWGIIGCGDVTEKKSGPAFYTLPNTTLHAVMRRNEALAADYAKRHHVPVYYTNADQLIEDPLVDAVYIATPPDSHAYYAIRAMEKGKPVYVEKPMALDEAACMEMVRTSERAGVPLFVAYYRRKMDYFRKVKEIVESGKIGKVIQANIRLMRPPLKTDAMTEKSWRVNPEKSGGGYFVDMGSHQIDLLIWLFGRPVSVSGVASNRGGLYEAEDTVEALFSFSSGILASGSWNFISPRFVHDDVFEIIGTRGIITFSTFRMDYIKLTVDGVDEFFAARKPETVELQMIASVSDMILKEKDDKETLMDAVEVTRVMDRILSSYRQSKNYK